MPASIMHQVGHPAAQRERVGLLTLGIAVFGAPLLWLVQLVLSYMLASYACYPQWSPLRTPLWTGLWTMLLVIGALALAGAIGSWLLAWRAWRKTRSEQHGSHQGLLDVGEGRTRFVAMCGMLMSGGFFVVLLFTTATTLFLVPACPG
jgi:hypothetical protein